MQIKLHPYNYMEQKGVIEYAEKHGIVTAGYSSLTYVHFDIIVVAADNRYRSITQSPGGPVDAAVAQIAKRIHATPAQVLMLWVRAKGVAVVTYVSSYLPERRRLTEPPEQAPGEIGWKSIWP